MRLSRRLAHRLLIGGLAVFGMLVISAEVNAQGVMYVADNKVGIGVDTPTELLHLFSSAVELKMRLEQGGATNAWAYSVVNSNPTRPNAFRISKQGSGGPEVDIIGRNDPSGQATMVVTGSIQATNVVYSSSRELKTSITSIDGQEILGRLADLPMAQWRLKTEDSSAHHFGPMAEDFNRVFELGGNGKTISVVDATGIALAAIQGLAAQVETRDAQIEQLTHEVDVLRDLVHSLAAQGVVKE